ncbi:GGDEF domain-containing protein [Nitratireductor kimnyeongensis]|uniref:diguanylate cyclase n=1 Tax=Nitratireductor kimnyeongensis TaxID=430679 RepID=A0ABW0TB55_9HYPH|nr:GGDEF domain-containing protein [Nitratireductor kimnyeongensis]QZZ37120.1 GGDEF domain-containing protein [Nitratireductor kimnyeongensis]
MKPVLLKAAIATLLSIIASLAISWVAIRLTGSSMNWFAAFMSTLCPLLIAFPASAYTFYQNHRIALAHQELEAAHRELAGVYRRLAASARIDDMTGLLNRSSFIMELNRAGQRGAGGVLLVIDADDFKGINDTHGHLTGDRALSAIANVIRDVFASEGIAGRIGGEEFGVFLEAAPLSHGRTLAERLRRAVECIEIRTVQGRTASLSVSIGVSFVETGADFSTLMAIADEQLYAAKGQGRNQVCAPGPETVTVQLRTAS